MDLQDDYDNKNRFLMLSSIVLALSECSLMEQV